MESKVYEKGILENRRAGATFSLFRRFFGASLEPPKDWVLGVDTSHWNGFCNFSLMRSKNIRFGITKATDVGSWTKKGFVDKKAIHNYTEMGKVGMLRGGYHWLDPRYGSPEYQADFYLENFYFKYPTELPPVLDFEDNQVISWNDMLWKAQVWLERVEEKTQRLPILYTSNGYMANFLRSKAGFLERYPLWDAHYIQRNYPTVPPPWKKATFWQFSDKGDFPFYKWNTPVKYGRDWGSGSSYLDMNWFMDTYDALLKFCGGISPPPAPTPVPEEDLLKIPLFSQKDSKWSADKLGTSSVTIGNYGCLITAAAMICKYYGYDTNPKQMNQDLIRVGGYENSNLLKFCAVSTIYPDVKVNWSNYLSNPQNAAIDAVLERGVPVIVQVDFKPDTPALDQHWAVIIGKDEDGYIIADPIDGKIVPLSRYANKAYRMVVYEKSTAPAPPSGVLFKAKFLKHKLYTRRGPGTGYQINGHLEHGDIVSVYEEKNGWFRINQDPIEEKWCSGHSYYMEKL